MKAHLRYDSARAAEHLVEERTDLRPRASGRIVGGAQDECLRVLIWGGSPLIRAGLRSVLQNLNDIELVGEIAQPRPADASDSARSADVIILDATAFGGDVTRVVQRLTTGDGSDAAGVVVLLDERQGDQLVEYLRAGARGLIFRDGPAGEIVYAVIAAARSEVFISPPVARHVVDALLRHAPAVIGPRAGPVECLTRREQEVFRLVIGGMSNAEIAAALSLSPKTVKFHVSNVLHKLGLRTRVHAILYCRSTHERPAGDARPVCQAER